MRVLSPRKNAKKPVNIALSPRHPEFHLSGGGAGKLAGAGHRREPKLHQNCAAFGASAFQSFRCYGCYAWYTSKALLARAGGKGLSSISQLPPLRSATGTATIRHH